MYLSKLDVFGFKSFAHKTSFQFNDGITAIIGPNGCGKSNIVDAIRWVLGEQRPSLLRLDKMENTIFNGTSTRKPLSLAEVSIHIENTKNILPSVYSEVKITRRLYRSGDSDYLINNRQVRLKDVIDLFADTGMGSDAYSVIELKMVEQILSDNAEERRRMFEEAAGIKKYKNRRKSALRKLDTTEQELVRLNDVISEVQKIVNSLSRQVGKARRYHQYKEDLQQKELFIYQLKMRSFEQELIPLREEYSQVRQTRERLGTEVNKGEAELEKLQTKSVDLEKQFREVSSRLSHSDAKITEIQQVVRLNEQKASSLKQNVSKTESEIETQQKKIEDLSERLEQVQQDKGETEQALETKYSRYQEKANSQLEAEEHLEECRNEYQKFREENVNKLDEIRKSREEYQRITLQKSNIEQQKNRLASNYQNLEDHLGQTRVKFGELEEDLKNAREDAQVYEKERALLRKQIEELENSLNALEEKKNQFAGEIEKLSNRKEFLQKLIENHEGFSSSVQYVMAHKQNYRGLIDTLANLVDTSDEYRPALESYLGEVANYLVVEEEEIAKDILNEIRTQHKGRLTLIPLSLLNVSRNGEPEPGQLNGETTPLKNVVKYDSRYKQLFDFLFDRVMLVKNMDIAIQCHKEFPSFNYLTQEGELLGDWGQLTGGDSRQVLNLTGRKQQFEKSKTELQHLEDKFQETQQNVNSIREQIGSKKEKYREFDGLCEQQQDSVKKIEQNYNQQNYELNRLQEQLSDIQQESAGLETHIAELSRQEKELIPKVQEADEQQEMFKREDERFNEKVNSADHHYRQISKEVQQLQMEYLDHKSKVGELDQKIEFMNQASGEAKQNIQIAHQEIENYRSEIETINKEIEEKRAELEILYRDRDEVEKEKLNVENNYQSLKSLIMAREDEIKKLHRRWNQALERLRELELRIQEIEVKQRSQREQMIERHGEDLDKLIKTQPVPEQLTIPQAQEDVQNLRKKIESLGEVNPLAIKEHEKEKERLEFLKSQQSDLLEAKGELIEAITKLNKTARNLFMDTFQKINENFKNVFGKFFEGGEAELKLLENDDPLEANIDISVRIKGRRLSTLSLMSAGEKTLTAISLLFAIYLVKPSPFCILDEVDAPLDDVNISRYTHALKEFSNNTQFILVTHNKMTMQAAQAMYGITMEEAGVSKVVSVRFD